MNRTRMALLFALLAVVSVSIGLYLADGPRGHVAELSTAEPAEPAGTRSPLPSHLEIALSDPAVAADPAGANASGTDRAPPPELRIPPRLAGTIEVHPTLGQFAPWITYDPLVATRLESESGDVLRPVKCNGPMYACCFERVPPGRYQVVVEAPIFRTFRSVFVEPGAIVFPILRGSASVAVSVIDVDGGGIEEYALEVQGDAAVANWPKALRTTSDPGAPKDGVYAVPPGDWTFTLRVPNRGTQTASVLALGAGETRALEFVLERPTRISGRVVDSRGFALQRPVTVQLQSVSDLRDSSGARVFRSNNLAQLTSPEGEFVFV